jgi:hypothetical protein
MGQMLQDDQKGGYEGGCRNGNLTWLMIFGITLLLGNTQLAVRHKPLCFPSFVEAR